MEENSSSGIYLVNRESPIEALLFDDLTCPKCGSNLVLDTRRLRENYIPIRYFCPQCKFVCPIKHEDTGEYKPSYGKEVYEFLSTFGDDIHDRVRRENTHESYYNDDGRTSCENQKDKK